jgi:hypothetical protein
MRVPSTILGVTAAVALALSPAIASGAKPAAKPVKASKPATVGKPITTGKPITAGKPTTTTHKPTTLASKPVKPTSAKPVTTNVKPAKTTTPKSHAKVTTTTRTTTTTTTLTPVATVPLNPIAAKIASKPNLNAKLTGMLPIDPLTGTTMTLNRASLGFKNQGQFIAALHVSQNLGIPFTELKSHMVTITPGAPGQLPTATQTGSLGGAIQASKSTANFTTEVQRAELQASSDLRLATQTTSTAVTTSTVSTTTKKNPTMPRGVR